MNIDLNAVQNEFDMKEIFIQILEKSSLDNKQMMRTIIELSEYYNMTDEDFIRDEDKVPSYVKDAQIYISQCEGDFGFMGSPKYDEAKKTVNDFFEPIIKRRKEQEEMSEFVRLKAKFNKQC